jgi:hypothetical protein
MGDMPDDVETGRRITTALQAAGVGNIRTLEAPAEGETRWSLLLDDSTTTIRAVRTLNAQPGVSRVRRRRFRSQELLFQVARPTVH